MQVVVHVLSRTKHVFFVKHTKFLRGLVHNWIKEYSFNGMRILSAFPESDKFESKRWILHYMLRYR